MSQNPESFDEVRRRRLARLAALGEGATTSAPAAAPANDSPVVAATTSKTTAKTSTPPARREKRSLDVKPAPAPSPQQESSSSPRATTTTPAQADKMLRRCLKVTIGKSTASLVGIPEVAGGGNLLRWSDIEAALTARVKSREESTSALVVLSESHDKLRKEGRNAKSRGDEAAWSELLQGCATCVRLGAQCLEVPETFGKRSEASRDEIATALIEENVLEPQFVRDLLRATSDQHLEAIAGAVAHSATERLKQTVDAASAANAISAMANFVTYTGKNRGGKALVAHQSFATASLSPSQTNPPRVGGAAGPLGGGSRDSVLNGLFEAVAQAAAASSGKLFEAGTALGLATRAGAISQDQAVRSEIAQILGHRPVRGSLAGKMRELGQSVAVVREALNSLCSAMVKNSPESRESMLRWFTALLARSASAEATVVDDRRTPSATARLNACATLLRLCKPVLGDADRESNAGSDLSFLVDSELGRAAFPSDLVSIFSVAAEEKNAEEEEDAGISKDDGEDSDAEMYDDDDEDMDEDLRAAIALSKEMDTSADVASPPVKNADFHFVATLFFLTLRATRLGLVCELRRHSEEQDHLSHHIRRIGLEEPRVRLAAAAGLAFEPQLLEDETLEDALRFSSWTCRWLLRLSDEDFKNAPEHFLEDACLLPTMIARFKPMTMRSHSLASPMVDLLRLISRCLSERNGLVRSPHLRDKLAQALYDCYLPTAAQTDVFARPRGGIFAPLLSTDPQRGVEADANVALLLLDEKNPAHAALAPALRALAPAILWLFGDAEHLGFYDVTPARLRVAALIRQLWDSPFHRAAFRVIAEDRSAFVTFANGLLNETNRLIASAMEKLPLVRDHQVRTGILAATTPELTQLREDYVNAAQTRRDELDERFADAERYLANDLKLCTETLGLVELLTSDDAVSNAFKLPELKSRLSGMLLSVMRAFTGRRSLDIKIENPEKYGFDPRDILTRVGRVATHFASSSSSSSHATTPNGDDGGFAQALASSGYFETTLLPKTAATLRKLNTLDASSLDTLENLARDANAAYESQVKFDAEVEKDAPDQYLDELTCSLMTDPVKLPSGHVCDSSTIKQHLLNEKSDPFSRMPLDEKDLEPLHELKREISEWIRKQREKNVK